MVYPTDKSQSFQDNDLHYSVIIPAYNEEKLLPATLAKLRLAMDSIPKRGETIVVDNNSTDNTPVIAKQHGAEVIFEPCRQIAKARNSGAKAARGVFFIFLDADTILPPPLLQKALKLLESGRYCGGGTILRFDSRLPLLAGTLVGLWNRFSITTKLAAGSFIFCLSKAFSETGGFDEHVFAGEEIFFSRKIKTWGKKNNLLFTISSDCPVVTSGRKFHWYSSLQIAVLLMFFAVFPFALRNRTLCSFWYKRPSG